MHPRTLRLVQADGDTRGAQFVRRRKLLHGLIRLRGRCFNGLLYSRRRFPQLLPLVHPIAGMGPQGALVADGRNIVAQLSVVPPRFAAPTVRGRCRQRSQQPGKARSNGGGLRWSGLLHSLKDTGRRLSGDQHIPTRFAASFPNPNARQGLPESDRSSRRIGALDE